MSEEKYIIIKGAREHNLKNIDVKIPKNKLTVVTGLSGSGKSSLAFDTVYAEGQRRYVESLSSYARQFLDLMKKPDVDYIEGLSPAISIEQKTTSQNPRSTVGTITEIFDYMRLLWARAGTPYSPTTGLPIEAMSVASMVDKVMELPEKTKCLILSPIAKNSKGTFAKEFENIKKQGFQRIKIDDTVYEVDELPTLDKNKKHNIEVVVDRIVIKDGISERLSQSFETALKLSDGIIYVENLDAQEKLIFSSKYACPVSGFAIEEIEPRLFSFNNPNGACKRCDGLGVELHVDEALVVPNENLSLSQGAIAPWGTSSTSFYYHALRSIADYLGISVRTPWKELSKDVKDFILYGSNGIPIDIMYKSFSTYKPFEGVIPNLERRALETTSEDTRDEISKYQRAAKCEACGGKRLSPQALAVKVAGLDIMKVSDFSISQALDWFAKVNNHLTPKKQEIASKILKEICERLTFLNNVGLNYLSLSRQAGTLSGGEAQRIRLASQIGSGLTGVLYILDEPSIGLHQKDNDRLLATLTRLRDLDNTVIVVEHDEDAIRSADYIIDMGPEAGINGGKIVAEGTLEEILKSDSLTSQYLNGTKQILIPSERRKGNGNFIEIIGAQTNNLKNVKAKFPLGMFVCVTGVSGGGKSSLVLETLFKGVNKELNKSRELTGIYKEIKGLENIDKVIDIDQSPIGRTPRSNPATYSGLFTPIREWFASLPEAKERGYNAGRFSFNVKGGRCEACQGDGVTKIEMHFLPDVYVQCDVCKGKRFNRETLEVKYKGKSIADVLDMSIDEAYDFFHAIPSIKNKLEVLRQVGLGYIKLGQQAPTLSGGEAQRIKLSKELGKRATGKTLYILDEPTTGLHFEDIKKLLNVLHALVDAGNSIVVIEHNLDVIKTADYIIDMGPDGGDGGGQIVAQGLPEQVAKSPKSYTAKYLKKYL
ncbi:MAG: excinuclease ABC subunit UvrA [Alphaproteobacteria bacterium]